MIGEWYETGKNMKTKTKKWKKILGPDSVCGCKIPIKPETRDETGGSTKTSISCETSSNFHTL